MPEFKEVTVRASRWPRPASISGARFHDPFISFGTWRLVCFHRFGVLSLGRLGTALRCELIAQVRGLWGNLLVALHTVPWSQGPATGVLCDLGVFLSGSFSPQTDPRRPRVSGSVNFRTISSPGLISRPRGNNSSYPTNRSCGEHG